jgi:hypothetical protein
MNQPTIEEMKILEQRKELWEEYNKDNNGSLKPIIERQLRALSNSWQMIQEKKKKLVNLGDQNGSSPTPGPTERAL